MTQGSYHVPVLLNEAVDLLLNDTLIRRIIADGTLGGGGYSGLIISRMKAGDRLISIDKDINAIKRAEKIYSHNEKKVMFINENFADIRDILKSSGFNYLSGIILDLGLSSYQLESEAGFSFMKDTELDMRADRRDLETASDILNSYDKTELTKIFSEFGEIRNPDRLSSAVIKRRKQIKYKTTFDLVKTVKEEYKINTKDLINFLAKIFQALRIKVNNELANLDKVLTDSFELMETGGRIVAVSYHSLEDRIVKNFFREKTKKYEEGENPFYSREVKPGLKILTKKPVVPSREEIISNPRSRSAKLRAAEKLISHK